MARPLGDHDPRPIFVLTSFGAADHGLRSPAGGRTASIPWWSGLSDSSRIASRRLQARFEAVGAGDASLRVPLPNPDFAPFFIALLHPSPNGRVSASCRPASGSTFMLQS